MKKVTSLLLSLVLLLSLLTPYTTFAAGDELDLEGEAAILMDYDSETILYEKNMNKKLYPASTTKMLTGVLAIENSDMDEIVTIDDEIIDLTDGSHIALDYDEEMSVKDLLHALLITSANDAALALAKNVTGSLDDFIDMMNERAEEIGALNTHFVNPNGLHDDNHVSSAYDLALIGKYAMENQVFRDIVRKDHYEIGETNKKDETRNLYSTNRFLYGSGRIELDGEMVPIKYDGVSGVKTGYTNKAKNNLVTFAERDGRRLLAVVLKSNKKGVYADTHKLLNHGFYDFSKEVLGHANEFIDNIHIENGELPFAPAVLDKDVTYFVNSSKLDKIDKKVSLKEDLEAPIKKGETLGSLEYYLDGEVIAKGDIVSTTSIKALPSSILLGGLVKKWYITLPLILLVVGVIGKIRRSNRRRRGKTFRYSPPIR